LTKISLLALDVRSVTHATGPDCAGNVTRDQRGAYAKALKASKTVLQGRDHVQLHCFSNLTLDYLDDFDHNKSLGP